MLKEKNKIPQKIILLLQQRGIIGQLEPLSGEDQVRLDFLEQIWGCREVLRSQLRQLSMKARLSLIQAADFSTKWERYAFNRFLNQDPGQRLPLKNIAQEIETIFAFVLQERHKRRLRAIRNRAQVVRCRKKQIK